MFSLSSVIWKGGGKCGCSGRGVVSPPDFLLGKLRSPLPFSHSSLLDILLCLALFCYLLYKISIYFVMLGTLFSYSFVNGNVTLCLSLVGMAVLDLGTLCTLSICSQFSLYRQLRVVCTLRPDSGLPTPLTSVHDLLHKHLTPNFGVWNSPRQEKCRYLISVFSSRGDGRSGGPGVRIRLRPGPSHQDLFTITQTPQYTPQHLSVIPLLSLTFWSVLCHLFLGLLGTV